MPRKNNIRPHRPYQPSAGEQGKTRYATRRQAEQTAAERMLLEPRLELHVYRGLDGGWYLTRRQSGLPPL